MTTHAAIVWERLRRSRRVTIGAVVLTMLALIGIFAELIAAPAPILSVGQRGVEIFPCILDGPAHEQMSREELNARYAGGTTIWPLVRYGPTIPTEAGPFALSSREHPLGTDGLGRDLVARLIYGARTALGLSLGAVLFSMLVGIALGGLAGYYRFWNDVLVRLIEAVETFPAIIVVALVRAIEREPSALSLVLAVAAVRWAEVARIVRVTVLRASVEDYVTAARAIGCTPRRIFWTHIFPNALGPVLVSAVFGVASVVLLETAISFLEMGAPTQVASWGETLAEGARSPSAWRLIVLPGLALLMTVGGSYLVADAMRDAMDPRTVRQRPSDAGEDSPLSMMWQERRERRRG